MKKNSQILKPAQKLSLGDLIFAVSSCTKNTKETVAAVADLLASGQVRVQSEGRFARARAGSARLTRRSLFESGAPAEPPVRRFFAYKTLSASSLRF